jgi:hypothetical protein
MGALNTRFRTLWVLAIGLPVLSGVVAFIFEDAIKPGHACTTGAPRHGALYFVVFLALAVIPGTVVGLVGWRSKREGEDTVGPFAATMCLAVALVFIGLLAGWHGAGCIT